METANRRTFLKRSALASAGAAAFSPTLLKSYSAAKPSETVNIAVAGIRNRGMAHIRRFAEMANVRIVALCDVDENLFAKAVAEIEQKTGARPDTCTDFRRLIEMKDLDAVSIATPDHWHALQTIWACQAGIDVYLEKPISYNIDEGRKIVTAARKYGRIVQTGTQSRGSAIVNEAIKMLHDGLIGEIYMGRALVLGFRSSIGRVKDSPVPDGVHWDLFLGPAPYRPFNRNRFHYNWHWFWDTSTTEFGNNGTHGVDVIRWAMQKRVHPLEIQCMGGFHIWDSDQEIPNVQLGTMKYDDGKIIQVDVRSLHNNTEADKKGGAFIYGSKGWMHLQHTAYETYFGDKNEPGPRRSADDPMPKDKTAIQEFKGTDGPHMANFIDCVRSRNWHDLNADILEGHLSTSLMHLGNIAYRVGRTLEFNGHSERFVNDEEADGYLTRQYRPPYVLPETV